MGIQLEWFPYFITLAFGVTVLSTSFLFFYGLAWLITWVIDKFPIQSWRRK